MSVLPAPAGQPVGLTLAVTSSTGVMGLAIGRVSLDSVELLADIEITTDRRHAEEISPRMTELLASANVGFGDLDRLVIDIGPGRFTGLRVGLATVRALGFALELPIIGLTSLSILAAGHRASGTPSTAGDGSGLVTAVIDARRNEVFQQTFDDGVPVGAPKVGEPEILAPAAGGVVIGDGVDRYLDQYRAAADQTGIIPIEGRVPKASVMLEQSRGLPGVPGTEIEPLYLREPDAKPNIKTRVGAQPAGGGAG